MVVPAPDIPPHLAAVWRQADELRAHGDVPAAITALEPAAEVASMAYGADSAATLMTLHRLAVLHRLSGDLAAARRVLDEAQAGGERRLGDDDPLMLMIAGELGAVAEELGNRHEARRNWSKVARYGPAKLGTEHAQVRAAQAYLNDDPAGPVYVPPARPVLGTYAPPELPPGPQPIRPFDPPPDEAYPQLPPVTPAPVGHGGHLTPLPHQPSPPQPFGNQPVEQGVWRVGGAPFPAELPPGAPPRRRSGTGRGLVLALVVVLLLGAAVTVVVLLTRDRGKPAAAPSATATATASASPSGSAASGGPTLTGYGAPGDVKLRDNGDHATLTWTDPSGGTVPFIVNGGRSGQQLHSYGTLPAGTTNYPVSGLNVNYDYCFVIVAVYTATDLVTSDLVCTHRHVTPTPSR